jgi:hypothetical protein
MTTWTVDRSRHVQESTQVEAESESEAMEIASELLDDEWYEYKGYTVDVMAYKG